MQIDRESKPLWNGEDTPRLSTPWTNDQPAVPQRWRASLLGLGLLGSLLSACQINASALHSGAPSRSAAQDLGFATTLVPHASEPHRPEGIAPSLRVATPDVAAMEKQVWQAINRIRRKHGLRALEQDRGLARVARQHSQNMLKHRFFSHTDLNGNSVFERVENAGIRFRLVAENLAWNQNYQKPGEQAVLGWMDSPSHRKNILTSKLQKTGVGIARHNGTYFFTQVFIR